MHDNKKLKYFKKISFIQGINYVNFFQNEITEKFNKLKN